MQTLTIKTCGECPMMGVNELYDNTCQYPNNEYRYYVTPNALHENCPLRKESLTIQIEINAENKQT